MISDSEDCPLSLLPLDFPDRIPPAKFQVGDRVYWHPCPTQDFGTITGLEYAPTFLPSVWEWRYAIWLDLASPSRGWVIRDVAWERDLGLLSSQTVLSILDPGGNAS